MPGSTSMWFSLARVYLPCLLCLIISSETNTKAIVITLNSHCGWEHGIMPSTFVLAFRQRSLILYSEHKRFLLYLSFVVFFSHVCYAPILCRTRESRFFFPLCCLLYVCITVSLYNFLLYVTHSHAYQVHPVHTYTFNSHRSQSDAGDSASIAPVLPSLPLQK